MRWFGEEYRRENIALAVLAAFTLTIAAYAFISRSPSEPTGEADLAALMPADYKPVLAALIRASGGECDQVCGAAIDKPALGSRRVLASCSIAAKKIACDAPRTFELTIALAP